MKSPETCGLLQAAVLAGWHVMVEDQAHILFYVAVLGCCAMAILARAASRTYLHAGGAPDDRARNPADDGPRGPLHPAGGLDT